MKASLSKKVLLFLFFFLLCFAVAWLTRTETAYFHLALSLLGMFFILFFPYSLKDTVESVLLPLLFFVIILANIPQIMHYTISQGIFLYSLTLPAKFYLFALLFYLILALFLGIFHLGINVAKIPSYTIVALLLCAFVTMTLRISVALEPTEPLMWFSNSLFLNVTLVLIFLALFTLLVYFFRELSLHNALKLLSLALILVANYLYFIAVVPTVALVMYALGVLLRIPRGRFSQL